MSLVAELLLQPFVFVLASLAAVAAIRQEHLTVNANQPRAARAERTEITQDEVLRGLHAEAREDKGASHAARVQAWTQLGKHLGMFVDRHEAQNTHFGRFTCTLGHDDDRDGDA